MYVICCCYAGVYAGFQPDKLPATLGLEAVGKIVTSAGKFKEGQRVVATPWPAAKGNGKLILLVQSKTPFNCIPSEICFNCVNSDVFSECILSKTSFTCIHPCTSFRCTHYSVCWTARHWQNSPSQDSVTVVVPAKIQFCQTFFEDFIPGKCILVQTIEPYGTRRTSVLLVHWYKVILHCSCRCVHRRSMISMRVCMPTSPALMIWWSLYRYTTFLHQLPATSLEPSPAKSWHWGLENKSKG